MSFLFFCFFTEQKSLQTPLLSNIRLPVAADKTYGVDDAVRIIDAVVVRYHSPVTTDDGRVVIFSPDGLGAAACTVAVDGGGDGDAAFGGRFEAASAQVVVLGGDCFRRIGTDVIDAF